MNKSNPLVSLSDAELLATCGGGGKHNHKHHKRKDDDSGKWRHAKRGPGSILGGLGGTRGGGHSSSSSSSTGSLPSGKIELGT